jgi:hypothetical protein
VSNLLTAAHELRDRQVQLKQPAWERSCSTNDSLACSGLESRPNLDPDLAAIVAAWPELPEAIKAGILAMIKAALK